jgi:urea transport system permease protein
MTEQRVSSPSLAAERPVPSRGRSLVPWIGAACILALIAYPLWLSSYQLDTARDALIFAIVALSLDYLWGKAGVLSFGQGAFFGIGAYAVAIIGPMVPGNNGALAGMAVGVTVACLVAAAVGYFLIFGGVRGAYLTIVTLAVTIIVHNFATSWATVTGGEAGILGAPPPGIEIGPFSYVFASSLPQYLLVATVLCLALLVIWLLCRGHYGRILAAMQDDETKLMSLGYHTSAHLLIVFTASAGLAALAGALYASVSGFMAPDLVGLLLSTQIIVYVALGGRGTLIGPIIGTVLVIRLQETVSSFSYALWPLIIGAFFIAMVFLFPEGLLPLLRRAGQRLTAKAPPTIPGAGA